MPRHFIELFDLDAAEVRALLDLALDLKRRGRGGLRAPRLAGRLLGMVFDKPSMRTRISFEAAMAHLGGSTVYMTGKEVGLGVREPLPDFARVVSEYVDALAVRTFSQQMVADLAGLAGVPVINALTDSDHPCQAMSDLLTIREALGGLEGVSIAFIGDGNNVARSLAVAAALTGMSFVLGCPEGYVFPDEFRRRFEAKFPGVPLVETHDPGEAVRSAEVVYTDVWCSMGQEQEADHRRSKFEPFRVDRALMAGAKADALFLHCLPAHRGEEVAAEVIDGPRSLIVPQAANRLHFQKALLLHLINGEPTAERPTQ
ncbi:ornithine carbamoyltransferase [Tautonia plasticadhaerens]|uniref:Ornithine carbamoyltransferase n=1 Tax=Tautonia plasticadhaerens TaxID=2527974 RepID=A0A518GZ90_9BACT|nr:ornithine carbamoyltransferase [Tautonia plasticadhaerens]QDV33907.1 Ornithine carbamoyltransferase [Tautonia plasticadhaerens]